MNPGVLERAVDKTVPAVPQETIQQRDWARFMGGLGTGSVDLILTDPPYSISRKTGFAHVRNGVGRFAVSMDFGQWDHKEINLGRFCKEAYRVLRVGGTAIVWYDLWKITLLEQGLREAGFRMIRLVIWEKTNPVPLNQSSTYLSNSREVAVCAVKGGSPTFHGKYDNGIYRMPIPRHGGKRLHPTQKPIHLFRELVAKHSRSLDMVVDPFLGSGTTAVAAIEEGRAFKGCDIDPGYIETARRRVANIHVRTTGT